MATKVHGFGTGFYGESDVREDGSYITTEWIAAAELPIFPLRSLRVRRAKAHDVNVIIVQIESYDVIEVLPIVWPQVLRIYGFVAAALSWAALMVWVFLTKFGMFSTENGIYLVIPLFFALALPFVVVVIVRKRAARNRR